MATIVRQARTRCLHEHEVRRCCRGGCGRGCRRGCGFAVAVPLRDAGDASEWLAICSSRQRRCRKLLFCASIWMNMHVLAYIRLHLHLDMDQSMYMCMRTHEHERGRKSLARTERCLQDSGSGWIPPTPLVQILYQVEVVTNKSFSIIYYLYITTSALIQINLYQQVGVKSRPSPGEE